MTPHGRTDPELLRQARSTVEERRPLCPTCGRRAPHLRGPASDRETVQAAEFFKPHGHRCPHGEPCPGWHEVRGEHATRCDACERRRA